MKGWLQRLWVWLTCFDACPFIFHHTEIREVQSFGWVRKLRCDRCGRYFAINHQEQAILPWDAELERLYCDWFELSRTNR
jgi:hypothetical protein